MKSLVILYNKANNIDHGIFHIYNTEHYNNVFVVHSKDTLPKILPITSSYIRHCLGVRLLA